MSSNKTISKSHIDYLERNYLDQSECKLPHLQKGEFSIPSNIKLVKINGISELWNTNNDKINSLRYLMSDVLAGLFGQKIPLVYVIVGEQDKLSVFLGTFQANNDNTRIDNNSNDRLSLLVSSLQSAYSGIDISKQNEDEQQSLFALINTMNHSGILIGNPTTKIGTENLGVEQIERINRGLYGNKWAYIVVSNPFSNDETKKLHSSILNELSTVDNQERSRNRQSPISIRYKELLTLFLKKVQLGKNEGLWHTSVYMLSDSDAGLNREKSIVKAVFGGESSQPVSIRTLKSDSSNLTDIIHNFGQITIHSDLPPGKIEYPYKYLNVANSRELGAFMHLPLEEMPGYYVKDYARFDVSQYEQKLNNGVVVGEILDGKRGLGYTYQIDLQKLNKHGLVVGSTGSGKTNTIFFLLKQIWNNNIPFLIIEPAKTEYRKLLHSEDKLSNNIRIFTLGNDMISPFRLNPFEIMPGVSVQTHIDHLKSVFNASFIMYSPMPYVLERCIHEIYQDKGWDLITSENHRDVHENAYPTMTDLYRKIEPVVDSLGYEKRITMDVKAALQTRINSLRIGGKGNMLDVRKSIPMKDLLEKPTILELEHIGDDDDKSFIIGLMFVFLYEYYVSKGLKEGESLNHITVVEEAHRLLKNIPQILDTELANSKGKAVEVFTNMLSEVRAYGEGFLIAEQIPTKLASDVIKNTNLKVMHRVVSTDDREIMGGTMNLNKQQNKRVTSLNVGEAVVYSEGDDSSFLIKAPYHKIESMNLDRTQENQEIVDLMKDFCTDVGIATHTHNNNSTILNKKEIYNIVENFEFRETLSRYILSIVVSHDNGNLIEEFSTVIQIINKLDVKNLMDNTETTRRILESGIEDYFEHKGYQYGWKYNEVEKMKTNFLEIIDLVLEKYVNKNSDIKFTDKDVELIQSFQLLYVESCKRKNYPFADCENVCSNKICLYRYNVEPLLAENRMHKNFIKILGTEKNQEIWNKMEKVTKMAERRLLNDTVDAEAKKRASLCFIIQKSESIKEFDFLIRDKIKQSMIKLFNEK